MELKQAQAKLREAMAQREESERKLLQAKEKLGRVRREAERLLRIEGRLDAAAKRLEEVRRSEGQEVAEVAELSTKLDDAKKAEVDAYEQFSKFANPEESISKLDDDCPILLLPLRTETRFKKIDLGGGRTKDQLWVRVFPDDVSIDTFETSLSENEVRNARSYWSFMWRAGEIEEDQRAAWRLLVSNHGSGRAYWIVNNYDPTNPEDKPKRDSPNKVNLIIAADDPPGPNEREALREYWSAFWSAHGDRVKQAAAWKEMVGKLTSADLSAAEVEAKAIALTQKYAPFNLSDPPPKPAAPDSPAGAEVPMEVAFVIFRKSDDSYTRSQSWSKAPSVYVLPERLQLLGFAGGSKEPAIRAVGNPIPLSLVVGPDPSAKEGTQLGSTTSDDQTGGDTGKEGELVVGEEIKWMVDFDAAVAKGMGFRVDLTPDQAKMGFDRLFILGVRLGAGRDDGKKALEALVGHHLQSRKGFGLVPQGTPTNNTETESSAYSWLEDPDESFDIYFRNKNPDDPKNWYDKTDGRWLAEVLGIDPHCIERAAHYYGADQREARAMNVALWPATLGYYMETMMAPVFSDDAIDHTRSFFQRYVSGRGMIPAVRVGKQPYGVLPATPFSRMSWLAHAAPKAKLAAHGPDSESSYLQALYRLLMAIDRDWTALSRKVPCVNQDGDAHQTLLDVVGLHPSSVEHHYRHGQGFESIYNVLNLKGLGETAGSLMTKPEYVKSGMDLLARLGYTGHGDEGIPDVLRKFYHNRNGLLKGPLVDDVPPSEYSRIRDYMAGAEAENKTYIQWLINAAKESHDALRRQAGFINGEPPTALLYLMLHHALDLGYLDAAIRLHQSTGSEELHKAVAKARQEPSFIHVQERGRDSGSRWQHLYKTERRITGDDSTLVSSFIARTIATKGESGGLREQLHALERLKDVPTARLERALVEHLDTCTYRLDAWILGLANLQLAVMRGIRNEDEDGHQVEQGLYLGAYGWLEDVRPGSRKLAPVRLDADLFNDFADERHPLMVDQTNGGYVHAPSVNHATTSAVLRSAYLSNASETDPTALAVNLSSERVRLALGVIEGIRNGQSLAALLGYRLERGLHDRHQDAEVDEFVFDLRKAFPLSANHLSATKDDAGDFEIQEIEARNVVDGLALAEQIRKSGERSYPFGRSDLPRATPKQAEVINEEVDKMLDVNDAVADLSIAECVHQAVMGNYDRAAATTNAFSKGTFPPTPEVIRTPRSGVTLTHRVGLQLESGLGPPAGATPRALAEPAINDWLSAVLPDMDDILCEVEFHDQGQNRTRSEPVSMRDLELLPIDVLYMTHTESSQAMTALDDEILLYIRREYKTRPDTKVHIKYACLPAEEGKIPLFELFSLLSSLRAIIQRSRPLTACDIGVPGATKKGAEARVELDPQRIRSVKKKLGDRTDDLATLVKEVTDVVNRSITKGDIGGEKVYSSLLTKGVLVKAEDDPDHARFGDSIRDESQLKSRLESIELSETLDALPDGVKLPDALPEFLRNRVRYDSCLVFIGSMSESDRDALLGLSADAAYQTAVKKIFDRAGTLPDGSETVETSEKLDALPDGVKFPGALPDSLKNRVRRDAHLVFTGGMSTSDRDALLGLSANAAYEAAVKKLFDRNLLTIWKKLVNDIAGRIDSDVDRLAEICRNVSRFGLPQSGFGDLLEWKRLQFEVLRRKTEELIARWEDKLAGFDALLNEYDDLPETATVGEKFALLQKAELAVSTGSTIPLPDTPDKYRDDLVNAKRRAFDDELKAIGEILSLDTLSGLYSAIESKAAKVPEFDLGGLDIDNERKQLMIFARDLLLRIRNLRGDLQKRLDEVKKTLPDEADDALRKRYVPELLTAGRTLLGDDFKIVPEFALTEEQAAEWQNAYDNREKLLGYQKRCLGEEFPVDGWLYGIARVREAMHQVENVIVLASAFDPENDRLELKPIQFPYHEEDHWLALEYPGKLLDESPFRIDEDKLLYTAYYRAGLDGGKPQCGLLVDEWTEVIPAEQETSGLVFHYDRPNSEPPQALLLATPSEFRGSWQWQDLVDALSETLDMARKRGIEPAHIDTTDYGRFLPALVSAFAVHPITAGLNLALNNKFYKGT